jgi:hypothetical protein
MSSKDFRAGVETVNKAAGDKFAEVKESLGEIKTDVTKFSKNQESINNSLIDSTDDHEDRLRALEDNRYFVRMSRHGLDDMNPIEQERLAAWLQKLMREFSSRGLPPTPNQQAFLTNLFKYIGIHDELMEVDSLAMIEDFGDSEVHEAIYKIFLALVYLHDESFSALDKFTDLPPLFRVSQSDRLRLQRILEDERIPTLGIPGLVGMFDPGRPLNSFTPESQVERYVMLNGHPLLDCEMQHEGRPAYLHGLALLAPKTGQMTERQRNYVVSLSNVLGCPECAFEVEKLWNAPQGVNVRRWQDAIENEAAAYAWALDAIALLALDDGFELEDTTEIERILRGVKLTNTENFIRGAFGLVRAKSGAELLEHIEQVWKPQHTDWRHVVDFCGAKTQDMFAETRKELDALWEPANDLGSRLLEILINITEYSGGIPDELDPNALQKMANKILESSRKKPIQSLDELKQKAVELIAVDFYVPVSRANGFLTKFCMPEVPFDQFKLNFMRFDEIDNSVNNDNWSDRVTDRINAIQTCLDEASEIASLLERQLTLFENGKLYQSAAADREREIAEKKRQAALKKEAEQREREAKATVSITVAGKERRFGIAWADTDEPPFIPSDVRSLASDGQHWIAVTHEGAFISENGDDWQRLDVGDSFNTVQHTDGTWILSSGWSSYAYSQDGKSWRAGELPEDVEDVSIHRCDGQWLLAGTRWTDVTYVEKGFIFDSKKTISYKEPVFYRCATLDGTWEFWKDPSSCGEGRTMRSNSFAASNHLLLSCFTYDYQYAEYKKIDFNEHTLCYFSKKKRRWTNATLPKGVDVGTEPKFLFSQDTFFCLPDFSEDMLVSDNGYEWRTAGPAVGRDAIALEIDGIFFIVDPRERVMHVSSDRKEFKELVFSDVGSWGVFASNGKEILAVYEPSKHESFLKRGVLNFAE